MKYIEPTWPAPKNIKAYTTVRNSWNAAHTWGSHTVLKGTKESLALQQLVQAPSEPVWLLQTHSTIAIEAKPENIGKNADASYTNTPNHVCTVLTADCLPILICNKQGTLAAAIHAGWRGLASGVIESTLQTIQHPPEDILVWLGPAIGPQKFEVGNDVYDAFVSRDTQSAEAFTPFTQDKWLANLYQLAKIRLKNQGVTNIYGSDFCTYTQEDLFFSYRRDKDPGRLASLIWIA